MQSTGGTASAPARTPALVDDAAKLLEQIGHAVNLIEDDGAARDGRLPRTLASRPRGAERDARLYLHV